MNSANKYYNFHRRQLRRNVFCATRPLSNYPLLASWSVDWWFVLFPPGSSSLELLVMLDARHSGHYKNKSVQLLLQKTICQQQYLQSYLRFVCQWEAQKHHHHHRHHHCGQVSIEISEQWIVCWVQMTQAFPVISTKPKPQSTHSYHSHISSWPTEWHSKWHLKII